MFHAFGKIGSHMLYLLISQLKTTYKLICIYFLSIKETIGGWTEYRFLYGGKNLNSNQQHVTFTSYTFTLTVFYLAENLQLFQEYFDKQEYPIELVTI